MASYNERALCVRLHCSSIENKLPIKCVTFVTRENEIEYKWPDHDGFYSLDELYQVIDNHLGTFEKSELPKDYWSPITDYIELSNYQYTQVDSIDCWITKPKMSGKEMDEKLSKMSAGQRTYLSSFGAALKSDMTNGKTWLQTLILNIFQMNDGDLSLFDLFWMSPSVHCSTNTKIEVIRGDTRQDAYQEEFSSPQLSSLSIASSDGSLTTDSYKRQIMPDFFICLPELPGVFPLVVELKPAGKENSGLAQHKQQMLSKIFFQDVIFGLIVTPKAYQVSVIIKKGENLHFATTGVLRIQILKNGVLSVNVEAVNDICTFIYRVMKWAKKTKCMLKSDM